MNKGKITFDRSILVSFILPALGYRVDQGGYVIEEKSGKPVLARDEKEIKVNEIAAITKEGIYRNDILSLITLSDTL